MSDQITITSDSPRFYDLGMLVSHSSDEGGLPDVGISVGLGDGWMMFAGEVPGEPGWMLTLYGQAERRDIAHITDADAARSLIERIAGLLCKDDPRHE